MELQESPSHSNPQAQEVPVSSTRNANDLQSQPAQAFTPRRSARPSFSATTTIYRFSRWWHDWISRTITHDSSDPAAEVGDPRDYLALERTFLGWLRTSLALISLAVVVTQLIIFQALDRTKGVVLGCVLTGAGMAVVVGAAVRFFRAQDLLVKGKALTGGWEAIGLWGLLVLVIGALFVFVLVED